MNNLKYVCMELSFMTIQIRLTTSTAFGIMQWKTFPVMPFYVLILQNFILNYNFKSPEQQKKIRSCIKIKNLSEFSIKKTSLIN